MQWIVGIAKAMDGWGRGQVGGSIFGSRDCKSNRHVGIAKAIGYHTGCDNGLWKLEFQDQCCVRGSGRKWIGNITLVILEISIAKSQTKNYGDNCHR